MVSAQTTSGWQMDVDRGPDWVFVRLHPAEHGGADDYTLAEKIWSILTQSFTYRLVLELEEVGLINSCMIAQLVLLSKRINSNGGLLRLCGLNSQNQEVVHMCRLEGCLPNYSNRGDAVMGHRPLQPR
jgi:anti-anti-sigma factor